MNFARQEKHTKYLNLTPLIDVLIFLLVFFMLTTQFVVSEVMYLNVAEYESLSNNSTTQKSASTLVILKKDGKFTLNGKEHKIISLRDVIQESLEKDTDKDIMLVTDDGVPVQMLVSAMEQIRSAGGSNISLASNK